MFRTSPVFTVSRPEREAINENQKDKTGQKFIVIVDEWDVLIRDEAANKKAQEDYFL